MTQQHSAIERRHVLLKRWIGRSVGRFQLIRGFAAILSHQQGTARSTSRFMIKRCSMNSTPSRSLRRPWYRPSLTVQILIGLVVGGVIGWLRPDWGNAVYFLRDIFINLIKSIIEPLLFSTVVVVISRPGALRKVGRMGIKALIYFEVVTTAALFIGLAV